MQISTVNLGKIIGCVLCAASLPGGRRAESHSAPPDPKYCRSATYLQLNSFVPGRFPPGRPLKLPSPLTQRALTILPRVQVSLCVLSRLDDRRRALGRVRLGPARPCIVSVRGDLLEGAGPSPSAPARPYSPSVFVRSSQLLILAGSSFGKSLFSPARLRPRTGPVPTGPHSQSLRHSPVSPSHPRTATLMSKV